MSELEKKERKEGEERAQKIFLFYIEEDEGAHTHTDWHSRAGSLLLGSSFSSGSGSGNAVPQMKEGREQTGRQASTVTASAMQQREPSEAPATAAAATAAAMAV